MLVQMDVRGVFSIVFRQIWKFLLIFVPIVTIALLYVLIATPLYESSAKLLVKFGQDARPDMAISQSGGGLSAEEKRGQVQSNVNILTSRDLAEALIKQVGAEKAYPDIEVDQENPSRAINAAVGRFSRDLRTKTESSAGGIEVAVASKNPETAKLLLDALLDLFIHRQSEVFGNPQEAVIQEQATAAYTQLEAANKELFDYKDKVGIASIDEEMTLLLNKRSDIAEYLSSQQLGADPPGKESSDPAVEQGGSDGADQNTSGIVLPTKVSKGGETPFPAIDEIQTRIDDLRTKELEFLRTYKPTSDVVTNIRKNIEAETEVLNKAVASLYVKLDELDAKIIEMNRYKAEYDVIKRKVELSEEMYKTAKTRLQAAEVNSDLNKRKITQISVLEQPSSPERPARPKKFLTMLLSIIAAGLLGVAVCLISELIDMRFSSPEQLSSYLKEPLLSTFSRKRAMEGGTVETASYWEDSLNEFKSLVTKKGADAATGGVSHVPASGKLLSKNSLSKLYQSLLPQLASTDKKIILVASSYKGEGASLISWELATYIAETIQKNVLFIDYSKGRSEATLLDVVRGKSSVQDVVSRLENGSSVISVASLADPQDSGTLVAYKDGMQKLLASLKSGYDYVVIPASNVLLDAAHLSLGQLADGTVFVIEADRTRAPAARQALHNLKEAGASVLGVVLNKRYYYIPKWLYRHL